MLLQLLLFISWHATLSVRAQQTVATPRGCGLTVNGPCCQPGNSSTTDKPYCRGAGLVCVWDTLLQPPLQDFGRCKRWISSDCGGIGQPCCSNPRGGLENRNAANPPASGTYSTDSPCANGLDASIQWRDARGRVYCDRHSKNGSALYRDSMSGICRANPSGCGRHGQQCCMSIDYELPTLYGCTCEEDTFVGTQRSWSTDYRPYDDRRRNRRCGFPRPVFRERAMYLNAEAMLGPAGFPLHNGDWDLRPQDVRSPDNCTRLCSTTAGCQYSLFIRFGTRSRCMLRRVEASPTGPDATGSDAGTAAAPVMYSVPSMAQALATTIRTAVMPGAVVPVFGGPDAQPFQCKGSAQAPFVNFQGGTIPICETADPACRRSAAATQAVSNQPATSPDACCLMCEAQTQPRCERWTFAAPYSSNGVSEPGRCYLKSDSIGVGESIAVPTMHNTAAAPNDAADQLVYTSGVLTGARVPVKWQGLLRNYSSTVCQPLGPVGERKKPAVALSTGS